MSTLGPITDARFAEAFAHKAIIPCAQAAALVGVDEKTLAILPIPSVPRGKQRGYTEIALRTYLLEGADLECPSIARPRAGSGSSTSSCKVTAITDLPGRRHDVQRRSMKPVSGSRLPRAS
ncbi:hypothetical protein [Synechococcus phage Yong-M4-211]|nr:hypothetical protein [Synechococcus phage Yong-M4-211]